VHRALLLTIACGCRYRFDALADGATTTDVTGSADSNLPSGLIHEWPLDEATGSIAADIVGGANATVMSPAAFTNASHLGDALASNSGGYAFVSMPGDMIAQSQLTVVAWLKRSAAGQIEQVGQELAPGPPYVGELSIQFWSDGSLYFCVDQTCGLITNNDTGGTTRRSCSMARCRPRCGSPATSMVSSRR